MTIDIMELAKNLPNLTISLTLADLNKFGEELVRKSKQNLEEILSDEKQERYLTPKQTAEMLSCSIVTLWRHDKRGILTPVYWGGLKKYKYSQIKSILNGGVK